MLLTIFAPVHFIVTLQKVSIFTGTSNNAALLEFRLLERKSPSFLFVSKFHCGQNPPTSLSSVVHLGWPQLLGTSCVSKIWQLALHTIMMPLIISSWVRYNVYVVARLRTHLVIVIKLTHHILSEKSSYMTCSIMLYTMLEMSLCNLWHSLQRISSKISSMMSFICSTNDYYITASGSMLCRSSTVVNSPLFTHSILPSTVHEPVCIFYLPLIVGVNSRRWLHLCPSIVKIWPSVMFYVVQKNSLIGSKIIPCQLCNGKTITDNKHVQQCGCMFMECVACRNPLIQCDIVLSLKNNERKKF